MENTSVRKQVMSMAIGEELSFPLAKTTYIRTLCQTLKMTRKMLFSTKSDRENDILIITRLN